ncbi:hypothetical protein GCM10027169_12160 [Gordonia jinhuaensis]|uniref:Uncharacterized protein n=1 Tax=Gordonia jinhuaensis TaxID=1517702 RepID=A0A916WUU5_9ACTN|nr:hypothetical protein [Gordonia jinhuaensis]GGB31852.1 hypothetical protein GCM10011489_20090 [Gordonia jinhuaensis]
MLNTPGQILDFTTNYLGQVSRALPGYTQYLQHAVPEIFPYPSVQDWAVSLFNWYFG